MNFWIFFWSDFLEICCFFLQIDKIAIIFFTTSEYNGRKSNSSGFKTRINFKKFFLFLINRDSQFLSTDFYLNASSGFVQKEQENMQQNFSLKNISGENISFDFSAAGHFSTKFFFNGTLSGHTGSNDTGLESIWPPGDESIAVHTQNKDVII